MARAKETFTASEIVIEIDPASKPSRNGSREPQAGKNANLFFKPLTTTLRGRWDNSRIRAEWDDDSPYRNLPIVPGIYVCLDLKARVLRAIDPLGFAENEELLATVQNKARKDQGDIGPAPDVVREGLNETELKTALWEMHQHVEQKHARLVRGEMPRRDDVLAMPGQLLLRAGGGNFRDYDPEYDLNRPLPPWATDRELEKLGGKPAKAAA